MFAGVRPGSPDGGARSSVDRLQIAEHCLEFGTFSWDIASGEIHRSQQLERIYGLPPGGFGNDYSEFARRVHPGDLAMVEAERERAIATGTGFAIEYRIRRADGAIRWVRSQGDAVRDASGSVIRVIGINVDITEQKRIREALALQEARLATALKLSDLLIIHQDRQLRYTWVANPSLGATRDDLIGRTDSQVLGAENGKQLERIKRRVMRNGKGERLEVQVTNKGRTGCFDLIVEPERGVDGRITGVICAATDITQRRQAQADLQLQSQLLNALDGSVNLVDAQGLLRYTNPKFDALFGYAPGELVGRHVSVLNAPESAEQTAMVILAALARNGRWQGELENRRKDGSRFWTHASAVAVRHPEIGECWLTLQADITDLRNVQAQRDAAYLAVVRMSDHLHDEIELQRAELAREVHDHIGSMLSGIRLGLDAALARFDREALLTVRAHVDEALRATRDLSGRLRPPMLDDIGLVGTVRWYVRDWSRLTGIPARVSVRRRVSEPRDPVRIDLFRVVQELLANVARHAGAAQVEVGLRSIVRGFRLVVRDDGCGFSPGQQEGYGLLGIRERMRRHGGDVRVESSARGSTITVDVPCDGV
jgi:PAS domain S-box-containing protein